MRQRAFVCWPAISKKSAGVWSSVQKMTLATNSPALAAMEFGAAVSWLQTWTGSTTASAVLRTNTFKLGITVVLVELVKMPEENELFKIAFFFQHQNNPPLLLFASFPPLSTAHPDVNLRLPEREVNRQKKSLKPTFRPMGR